MEFPIYRPRRLGRTEKIRSMLRETLLTPADLIYPLFAIYGKDVKNEIVSMPGQFQLSVDNIVKEAKELHSLGVPALILFGIPEHKDER